MHPSVLCHRVLDSKPPGRDITHASAVRFRGEVRHSCRYKLDVPNRSGVTLQDGQDSRGPLLRSLRIQHRRHSPYPAGDRNSFHLFIIQYLSRSSLEACRSHIISKPPDTSQPYVLYDPDSGLQHPHRSEGQW
jgi:hypothetical protein